MRYDLNSRAVRCSATALTLVSILSTTTKAQSPSAPTPLQSAPGIAREPSAGTPRNTSDDFPDTEIIENGKGPQNINLELQRAQTAYYDLSAQKIIDDATFIGWMKANAALIGALLAAFVAFLTFRQNKLAADRTIKLSLDNSEDQRRSQRDSQFYEALKRFGDKDSPALRASASALIAQMARNTPIRTASYIDVAVDQFSAALRLEQDPVVIESIISSIRYLAGVVIEDFVAAQEILERVYVANRALQNQLISAVLRYLFVSGTQPEHGRWPPQAIAEIAARTGYEVSIIGSLLRLRSLNHGCKRKRQR